MMATNKQKTSSKKLTTTEVIAMFRALNLPVMDDQRRIETRGEELEELYSRHRISPDPQQSSDADRWFKNLTTLKNQRPALLDIVRQNFSQLADATLEIALSSGIKKLNREVYTQLERIALEQCNCDPPLARDFVEDYLGKKGIGIEENLVFPHLVEGLTAVPKVGIIELSWKLPDKDCDEVIVRRFETARNGGFKKKGQELCRGRSESYFDQKINPGMQYRYEVYSIWHGIESQGGVRCEVIAVGETADVRVSWVSDHVELSWRNPSKDCQVYIFRSTSPMSPVRSGTPTPLPDNPVEKLFIQKDKPGWHDRQVTTGTEYHYLLVAYFAAGIFSNGVSVSIHTPIPPPTVPSIRAEYKEGAVNISWEPARSAKPVDYVIVRREGSTPAVDVKDGIVVQTTRQTRGLDQDITAGQRYTYTVFTRMGDVYSRLGKAAHAVDILADVTGLSAKSGDRTIELHWQTPENVSRVIVRRGETSPPDHEHGHPVKITGWGHAKDEGLENGRSYFYLVCCAYRPLGTTEFFSAGVYIEAIPDRVPEPVNDFMVGTTEKEVVCTWTPPDYGQVVVIRSKKPHGLPIGQRLTLDEIDSLGERIITGKDCAHDLNPDIGKPYYSVFAVAGTNAIAGGSGCGVVCPDITSLKLSATREGIIMRWVWPQECNTVRILRRQDNWPDGPEDPKAAVDSCTRIEYKNAGEKYVDIIRQGQGNFHYVVYARASGVDGLFFSPGKEPGCKAVIQWKPWMTLKYKLSSPKKREPNGQGILLTWSIEEPFPDFAGFVLVASKDGPPSSLEEGVTIFHWQAEKGITAGDYSAWINLPLVRQRGWSHFFCKVIITDPDQRPNTLVIHPNTCITISAAGEISNPMTYNAAGHNRFAVPRTVICPYCFKAVPIKQMLFDSYEGGEAVTAKYTWLDRLLHRPPQPPKNKQGKRLFRKLCPDCKHDLPFTAGMQESLVIGIIGAHRSGKSHYIAALIDRLLGQVGADFQASLMAVTEKTSERFQDEFYEPLFGRGLEIPSTIGSPPPLIYDLTLSGKLWSETVNRTVTLALYDTQGENLNKPDRVRQMVKYLRVASGIIFLIDPLQSPEVRDSLPYSISLPDVDRMAEPYEIISRVLKELENGKILTKNDPLLTPVAVALTKCDVLRDAGLIASNRLWSSNQRHVGYFNTEIHDDMAGMMGEGVRHWSLKAYNTIEVRFPHHAFFGVSSTGCASSYSSDQKTRRYKFISPWRVEDPLLWLLAKLGVIPVR
ncbi:MAG: hypothetical protein PVH61_08945 [Candidatus Aminicenantes bacterium]